MANFNQILAFWVLSCIVAGAPTVEENCVKIDDFVTQQPTLFVGKNLLSAFHQSKMYCESTQFTECKSMYYVKDENTVRKMKVLRKLMAKQETEEQVGAVSAQFKQYADCPYILQMKWCVYEGLVKDVTEEKKFMNAYFGFEYYIQTFSSQPGKRSVVNYYRENLGILQRLKIWLQMAKAVEELHKKNYIHGSIRPEAFAVLKNDFSVIKMCDLGDAGSETPMKSMSLQFFVPPEGFDRPEARKLAYDVYSLTATFASLELGFQALKNVQDFFQGAENSEKYTSMLCSAIIKEMEINHHSKLDAEQQTVLAKIMTEGLKYDENTRPPIGKVVERIERLINSLEKPAVVEEHSAGHENEEKIEELMRMATVIPDDLNQENDNQVIEEGGVSSKKSDENADGTEPAEKHEAAEVDTGDAHEDKPASEVVEEKPTAEAEVAGTPEKHVSQHRPPIDIDDTDKMVVDTGAKSATLVQEKPMSPIFSDFIDKEKKKRNAKPSEEETEQENIDDFSDASDIADSYNNESPWAFFSVLIVGAFLISASIFYWALD